MLIEKYLQAAKSIVVEAVPKAAWIMPSMQWKGAEFLSEDGLKNGIGMHHDRPLTVQKSFEIRHASQYRLVVKEKLHGSFDFHPGRYKITCLLDGIELYSAEYKWEENKLISNAFDLELDPGLHTIAIRLSAVKNDEKDEPESKDRSVSYEIASFSVDGPHPKTKRGRALGGPARVGRITCERSGANHVCHAGRRGAAPILT